MQVGKLEGSRRKIIASSTMIFDEKQRYQSKVGMK